MGQSRAQRPCHQNQQSPWGVQAVLSLCDGNTMGPHIVGDLVCVLLAAAQAPWLCSAPCSLWMSTCSIAWLAARVSRCEKHMP